MPGTIAQDTTASVELHSTPITIGQATVKPDNTIEALVSIPNSVSPGIHQLHILYTDATGQQYDLYKNILVIASVDDYDGDGLNNNDEACVVGDGSGVDSDKDGIDDVCDGEYVAVEQNNNVSSVPESQNLASAGKTPDDTKLSKTGVLPASDEPVFVNSIFSSSVQGYQSVDNGLEKTPPLGTIGAQSINNKSSGNLGITVGIAVAVLAALYACFMIVKKKFK